MYQRHELFGALSPDDVSASLNACALAEKDEYTEDEVYRFRECRQMVEQKGKTYEEVAELFQRNGVIPTTQPQTTTEAQLIEPEFQSKAKKPKNGKKPPAKPVDFFELLSVSSELLGNRVLPKEAIKLLEACGLSADAEQYSQEECDRFLEACDMLKIQGKTYEEIATHFGTGSESQNPLAQVTEIISDSAVVAELGLESLVDKVTDRQTDKIPGLVNRSYLKHAARKLAQNQENTELFFAELEERVMAQIEGKNSARSLQPNWDWAPNSLPSSSPKPMILPEGSENGTSGE